MNNEIAPLYDHLCTD